MSTHHFSNSFSGFLIYCFWIFIFPHYGDAAAEPSCSQAHRLAPYANGKTQLELPTALEQLLEDFNKRFLGADLSFLRPPFRAALSELSSSDYRYPGRYAEHVLWMHLSEELRQQLPILQQQHKMDLDETSNIEANLSADFLVEQFQPLWSHLFYLAMRVLNPQQSEDSTSRSLNDRNQELIRQTEEALVLMRRATLLQSADFIEVLFSEKESEQELNVKSLVQIRENFPVDVNEQIRFHQRGLEVLRKLGSREILDHPERVDLFLLKTWPILLQIMVENGYDGVLEALSPSAFSHPHASGLEAQLLTLIDRAQAGVLRNVARQVFAQAHTAHWTLALKRLLEKASKLRDGVIFDHLVLRVFSQPHSNGMEDLMLFVFKETRTYPGSLARFDLIDSTLSKSHTKDMVTLIRAVLEDPGLTDQELEMLRDRGAFMSVISPRHETLKRAANVDDWKERRQILSEGP